jgi:hypothetical protein
VKKIKKLLPNPIASLIDPSRQPLANQDGSVIVLVLMVLVIMTVIGLVSSDTLVTENFIVRNEGIHKQNVSLVESALIQGLQEYMQIDDSDPANFDPDASSTDWINDRNNTASSDNEYLINTIWYQTTFTQRCLNANNSRVSSSLSMPLLTERGENGNGNLRYAMVGWQVVPGESVKLGKPIWRQGRILAEYVSADAGGKDNGFGMLREEMGIKRKW